MSSDEKQEHQRERTLRRWLTNVAQESLHQSEQRNAARAVEQESDDGIRRDSSVGSRMPVRAARGQVAPDRVMVHHPAWLGRRIVRRRRRH